MIAIYRSSDGYEKHLPGDGVEIGHEIRDCGENVYECVALVEGTWTVKTPQPTFGVIVPDYRVIDGALPPRAMRYVDPQGRVRRQGIDPTTGVDTDPLTKLYPRVNKKGKPVFLTKRERDQVMRSDEAKARGFVDVR